MQRSHSFATRNRSQPPTPGLCGRPGASVICRPFSALNTVHGGRPMTPLTRCLSNVGTPPPRSAYSAYTSFPGGRNGRPHSAFSQRAECYEKAGSFRDTHFFRAQRPESRCGTVPLSGVRQPYQGSRRDGVWVGSFTF